MSIKVGIDASRNRSGGAQAHIIGILSELESLPQEIEEVHVWSYSALLNSLPEQPWLIKHAPPELDQSIFQQLWWQNRKLTHEARSIGIDILLNTDAGTVCRFHPSITMSRDMLSYEKGEIQRYGFGISRLRLIILRYVQNYSLKKSEGAIFLTEYASNVIQGYCGKIGNYAIIPHGVSKSFKIETNHGVWEKNNGQSIKCIYVSNVDLYKHQWHVIKAIKLLRQKGYDLEINFVGGGGGKAQKLFDKEYKKNDPTGEFIKQTEFIKHSEIPSLLEQSDIFIFASSCENMPNTLVEGMCSGLPIACSNRGPMPEVLRDGGVYFDPENYKSIVLAVEKIINDEFFRLNISQKAKDLSEQYNWSRCAKETFAFLVENAIQNR